MFRNCAIAYILLIQSLTSLEAEQLRNSFLIKPMKNLNGRSVFEMSGNFCVVLELYHLIKVFQGGTRSRPLDRGLGKQGLLGKSGRLVEATLDSSGFRLA